MGILYKFPLKLTKSTISPTRFCLHQKNKRLIQFILIFCKLDFCPSKLLKFLSFQRVHHMQAGIVLHQCSFLPLFPIPFQLFSSSFVVLGITHLTPNRTKNMFHRLNAAYNEGTDGH